MKRWLDSYKYNQIILGSLNSPIFYMDSDMIKYLLTAELDMKKRVSYDEIMEHTHSQINFKYECQYLMRQKDFLKTKSNFDIEGVNQVLSSLPNKTFTEDELEIIPGETFSKKEDKTTKRLSVGLDIDFNTAIELLDKHFQNKNRLSKNSVYAIIRSIATEIQKQLGIENNGMYYFEQGVHNNKIRYGAFYSKYLSIAINRKLIDQFLDFYLPLYQRLQIFIYMFHEIKHAKINQNKRNNIWDIDTYEMEKEHIVREFDGEFYDSNYKKIKEEISARISSYDILLKFIETYFSSSLLNKIQNETLSDLEKEKSLDQTQNYERIMTFFKEQQIKFNVVFDTLIKHNPNILDKHSILKLEYHPSGIPKSAEEIYLDRTEENKELIDEIIKKRYPEPSFHERTK